LIDAKPVAAKVSAPGLGSIVLYSAYFTCGAGWDDANEALARTASSHADKHGLPWAIATDWNMSPEEVSQTGFPGAAKAVIRAPVIDTCISPACSRVLDFFLVDNVLAEGVTSTDTVLDASTRPHRPAQLTLRAGLKAATKTIYKAARRLPVDPVIGPMRQPPSFDIARKLALEALDLFEAGNEADGFVAYDAAFSAWATPAEAIVAAASDVEVPAYSARAERPVKIQVPLVPSLSKDKEPPVNGWVSNMVQKAQEISAQLLQAWRSGGQRWTKLRNTAARTRTANDKLKADIVEGKCKPTDPNHGLMAEMTEKAESLSKLATETILMVESAMATESAWVTDEPTATESAMVTDEP